MGTDQVGKALRKHVATTIGVGTTQSADRQVDIDRPAVSGQIHEEAGVVAVLPVRDPATQGTYRCRPDALDGQSDVWRRRFLFLDAQTETPEEFPHRCATPRQTAAKGFAACRETPPGRGSVARNLRETPFYPGDDRGRTRLGKRSANTRRRQAEFTQRNRRTNSW